MSKEISKEQKNVSNFNLSNVLTAEDLQKNKVRIIKLIIKSVCKQNFFGKSLYVLKFQNSKKVFHLNSVNEKFLLEAEKDINNWPGLQIKIEIKRLQVYGYKAYPALRITKVFTKHLEKL